MGGGIAGPRKLSDYCARKTANEVAKLSKQIAEEAGIRKLTVHDAISLELMDC